MDDVYYGILFSLFGNIAINVGHHLKLPDGDSRRKKLSKLDHSKTRLLAGNGSMIQQVMIYLARECCNYSCIKRSIGQLLFIGGSLSNAYSLPYAPQTLLSCIGSIQFVTNLICSAIFYKQRIRLSNFLGTCGVIIGCLMIVFLFHANTQVINDPTIADLINNFNSHEYINYLCIVLAVFATTLVCFDFLCFSFQSVFQVLCDCFLCAVFIRF